MLGISRVYKTWPRTLSSERRCEMAYPVHVTNICTVSLKFGLHSVLIIIIVSSFINSSD